VGYLDFFHTEINTISPSKQNSGKLNLQLEKVGLKLLNLKIGENNITL
jgi:hypothetical protein